MEKKHRCAYAGTKIAQLEGKKRAAVEEEDYDLAKELKQEVDKLRWDSRRATGMTCGVNRQLVLCLLLMPGLEGTHHSRPKCTVHNQSFVSKD